MRLDDWLKQERLTATEFAERAGVSVSTITRILPGIDKKQVRNVGPRTRAKIVAATGGAVTHGDLVDPAPHLAA